VISGTHPYLFGVSPGVLKSGFPAGDHVELVVHQLQGPVGPNSDGHAPLVRVRLQVEDGGSKTLGLPTLGLPTLDLPTLGLLTLDLP